MALIAVTNFNNLLLMHFLQDIFTVDVSTRQVRRLTEEAGTWSVLDVYGNIVLAAYSSLNIAPRMVSIIVHIKV